MIDLHTHTTCSDGTDSPHELINRALAQGINTIALTDHDTTSGWAEAIKARRANLNLVLGSEISCLTEDGISVHMLGLLFDGEDHEMQIMLENTRDGRIPRMKKIVELLNKGGYEVTLEDVYSVKPEGATLGRPHLADALVKRGIVKSRDEAFQDLLNNESPFYVAHLAPTPIEAVKQIRKSGGVAVIAHPFASHRGQILTSDAFAPLKEAGLNGIEVDHRDQSLQERAALREIAHELDLVVTGSSDFHGTGKLNLLGENTTDPGEWERLEEQANARRVVSE